MNKYRNKKTVHRGIKFDSIAEAEYELLTEEQIKSVNPDYWKFAELYEVSEDEKE